MKTFGTASWDIGWRQVALHVDFQRVSLHSFPRHLPTDFHLQKNNLSGLLFLESGLISPHVPIPSSSSNVPAFDYASARMYSALKIVDTGQCLRAQEWSERLGVIKTKTRDTHNGQEENDASH